MTKVLVPGLECGEPKYRVCLHYRDWMPGEYIQDQIMQSVEASRRTIIVLSSSFIESVWGQLEFLAAHSQALQDRTNRLIIIVYGKVGVYDIFVFCCMCVNYLFVYLFIYYSINLQWYLGIRASLLLPRFLSALL